MTELTLACKLLEAEQIWSRCPPTLIEGGLGGGWVGVRDIHGLHLCRVLCDWLLAVEIADEFINTL